MANIKLFVPNGLRYGWCLGNNSGELEKEYRDDCLALEAWVKLDGDLPPVHFLDFKQRVFGQFKKDLEDLARISHNSSNIASLSERQQALREHVALALKFLLITEDEAADIEILGGAGDERKRALDMRVKPYRPDTIPASWTREAGHMPMNCEKPQQKKE